MTVNWRRFGSRLLCALGCAYVVYLLATATIFIYENGPAVFVLRLVSGGGVWAIALAGVGAYFWIARGFVDRIAYRRHWRPFVRDLVNLACFAVIVPSVGFVIYYGTLFLVTPFAASAAP